MNDTQNKIVKVHDSITHLRALGMNVPEVLHWNTFPIDAKGREANQVLLLGYLSLCKDVKIVIPPRYDEYISISTTKARFKDYDGSPALLLKAPKTRPLIAGDCVPTPYYNRITIGSEERAVTWGSNVKDMPFPVGLRKCIIDLNSIVVRGRLALDGTKLHFTFHTKSEGLFGDRIILWGISES